jgi:hypothetical protein
MKVATAESHPVTVVVGSRGFPSFDDWPRPSHQVYDIWNVFWTSVPVTYSLPKGSHAAQCCTIRCERTDHGVVAPYSYRIGIFPEVPYMLAV